MCRLFGLNAGHNRVHVRYWLEDAPDSIEVQSKRNPDGTGAGWFDADGQPQLRRDPVAAERSEIFARGAGALDTNTVVTHIRYATTGARTEVNCHPFLMGGRLMAHNGGFGDLQAVQARLGDYNDWVSGQTDSERYAALIALETDRAGGDVAAGITAAATWLAANVPLYSLNTIVIGNGHLWALRYPDSRALHLARRVLAGATGAPLGAAQYLASSAQATHAVAGDGPVPVVVVASERIDQSPDWQMLAPGELVHVAPDLSVTSQLVLNAAPAHYVAPTEADPNIDTF